LYEALHQLSDPRALARLMQLLKSRSYRTRCAAANTLADLKLGDRRAAVRTTLMEAQRAESSVAARSSIENALRKIK
jgi:HEAT repeat protein